MGASKKQAFRRIVAVGSLVGALGMGTGSAAQAQLDAPLTVAEERRLKPMDRFRECEDCPEMVVVPAGACTMGAPESEHGRLDNEGPPDTVTIAKPFAIGEVHVPVSQFEAFVRDTAYGGRSPCVLSLGGNWKQGSTHSWRDPGFAQEPSHPMVCVSWNDANEPYYRFP